MKQIRFKTRLFFSIFSIVEIQGIKHDKNVKLKKKETIVIEKYICEIDTRFH